MKNTSSRRDFIFSSLAIPLSKSLSGRGREAANLPTRALGKTGLKVTPLGFGCMTTSDPAVIERAADLGVNYFDTARAYQNGNNERMVGTALKGKRPTDRGVRS